MASIIPGYEYDIFISYRQKDNKYDGWVTVFVENLKKELEATFKDDISIYFDINPEDGLSESHEVSDSLRDKLKCLIFIPIISQTYCDPKSFAWEHEFKSFIKGAANDQFGIKIKILNGNISSRILPIKIHDIRQEDIELFESASGMNLRGIEFIYKSLGVNRPLRANEDHAQDNLNKSYYRDQINKAAHVINDIITALNSNSSGNVVENFEKVQKSQVDDLKVYKPGPLRITRPMKIGILFFVLILLVVFSFYWMNRRTSDEILERVTNHYDLFNNWGNYYGKIHLISTVSAEIHSEEIIEINTKENSYKSTMYAGKDTIVKGIKDGRYFREVNRHADPAANLDTVSIDRMKDHHYWQFGGVMFLKSSGLVLEKKVVRTKFQGVNCLTITFSSDSKKIKSNYLKSTKWDVYVNPDNSTILGYRTYGMFGMKDDYIICQGELENNGIKMPLIKIYYSSLNNTFRLADIFQKVE